ncbi:hypothetical protein D3C77_131420 [compost metagenome]
MRAMAAGSGLPKAVEKFSPQRISCCSAFWKLSGRASIDSRLPSWSRVNRSGRAASSSGVMVGKEAMEPSVSVRV